MATANLKDQNRTNKRLLQELPFYGVSLIPQSTNNLDGCLPTKKQLDCLTSIHDLDLFSLNNDSEIHHAQPMRCKYYSPHSFSQLKNRLNNSKFSLFHNNVRSLKRNLDNLQTHLLDELHYNFSVIGVTETRINKK